MLNSPEVIFLLLGVLLTATVLAGTHDQSSAGRGARDGLNASVRLIPLPPPTQSIVMETRA